MFSVNIYIDAGVKNSRKCDREQARRDNIACFQGDVTAYQCHRTGYMHVGNRQFDAMFITGSPRLTALNQQHIIIRWNLNRIARRERPVEGGQQSRIHGGVRRWWHKPYTKAETVGVPVGETFRNGFAKPPDGDKRHNLQQPVAGNEERIFA